VRWIVASIAAAVVLASCATGSSGAHAPVAAPTSGRFAATVGSPGAHPGTPVDVGLIRLWLPAAWHLVSDWCTPRMKVLCFMPPCPGANDTVYVASWPNALDCRRAVSRTNSVWITTRRVSAGPATWRVRAGTRRSVFVQVPALGATIEGFGRSGVRVAERFGPSTLRDLLAATLPVAVPRGWRRVHFGTLSVLVPPRWPVQRLNGSRSLDPGACGDGYFWSPMAVTGFSMVTPSCPFITPDQALQSHSRPCNGVWLQATGLYVDPSRVLSRDFHGIRFDLRPSASSLGSNSVQVVVHDGGRTGDLVLGLGRTAGIAEAILSSLRV